MDRKPPPLDQKKSSSKNSPENSGEASAPDVTKVDLGDDLMVTVQIDRNLLNTPSDVESAEDQLATAKILVNEGLLEDAKKTLRKILIHDPDHQAARVALKEILDGELKDLLSSKESIMRKPRVFERHGKEARGPEPTTEQVVKGLEEALGPSPDGRRDLENQPIVAQESIKDLSVDDRIDIGIAFMEMSAFDKAAEIFRTALHFIDENSPEGQAKSVATHILLARAYLEAGRSFEAIQILHPLVRNDEISVENKVEFFYLMGIAHDLRKERKIALAWFGKVREIDPHFRDIRERLRRPIGKSSK